MVKLLIINNIFGIFFLLLRIDVFCTRHDMAVRVVRYTTPILAVMSSTDRDGERSRQVIIVRGDGWITDTIEETRGPVRGPSDTTVHGLFRRAINSYTLDTDIISEKIQPFAITHDVISKVRRNSFARALSCFDETVTPIHFFLNIVIASLFRHSLKCVLNIYGYLYQLYSLFTMSLYRDIDNYFSSSRLKFVF